LCREECVLRDLGDPGGGDDHADLRVLVPLLREQPDGRLDQPAAYRRLLRPRHPPSRPLARPTAVAYRLVGMVRKTPGIDLAGLTALLAGLLLDHQVHTPQVRLLAGRR